MKSEKHPNEKPKEKIKFPILMEHADKDFIVLFGGFRDGVVVYSAYKPYPVGFRCENWTSAHDQEAWTPYKGSIVLSSE